MFDKIYGFYLLLLIIAPIVFGIFILRRIDKNKIKKDIEVRKLKIEREKQQIEREKQLEKNREKTLIRVAEWRKEVAKKELLKEREEELLKKEELAKKELLKKEDNQDRMTRNIIIRKAYYKIQNMLLNTDKIEILTQDDQNYLSITCSNVTTSIAVLSDFKYHFKYRESYAYKQNFQKDTADKKVFNVFNKLKLINSFTDKHSLLLDTKDINNKYVLEVGLITKSYSSLEIEDLWDDFNHFSSQLNYSITHNI